MHLLYSLPKRENIIPCLLYTSVEGESAVVKAEEGNTATEQEAAPALSEEELNEMCIRDRKDGKQKLGFAERRPRLCIRKK